MKKAISEKYRKISGLLILLFVITCFAAHAQSLSVKGRIMVAGSSDPLPFATVGFKHTNIGTVSDQEGFFTVNFPAELSGDTIVVSYLGYQDLSFVANEGQELSLFMEPAVFEFKEIVIGSVSPGEFLRKAIAKIPENYINTDFQSLAHYSEKTLENDLPVDVTEAAFLSHRQPYSVDDKSIHQLVLYRKVAEDEMQFMREKAMKRKAKREKRARKTGAAISEEEDYSVVRSSFGGPDELLKGDPLRKLGAYLDTTSFHKYRYEFISPTTYRDQPVEVIRIGRKHDPRRETFEAHIYIDVTSHAIIRIDSREKFAVPATLKPVLYAFGFSLSEGELRRSYQYRAFQGEWYPENLSHDIAFRITKHKLLSRNEHAQIAISQSMSTREIIVDGLDTIPEEKRYQASQEMQEQVRPGDQITWERVR